MGNVESLIASKEVTQILQSNALLANNMYKILSQTPGNVFFSPFSVHAVLSMAYQGAREETAKAIAETLKIPDAKLTATGYKSILESLENIQEFILHVAFKICVMKGEVMKDFEKDLEEYFKTKVQRGCSASEVNKWVAQVTRGKITEILGEDLPEDTALVLINAIYFKADWEKSFSERSTEEERFYLSEGNTIEVQMMRGRKKCYYHFDEALNAKTVALPYKNYKSKMIIILPEDLYGIEDLEMKLPSINLGQLARNLQKITKVDIALPKFKFETTMPLNDIIKKLGLDLIFHPENANFSGMTKLGSNENLYVHEIVQKAYIAVNEKGSKAAAVTYVATRLNSLQDEEPEQVPYVVVNHPCIFMVVQGSKPNILFCGRLSHPQY